MNEKKIRVWMLKNDLKVSKIAHDLGMHYSVVSHWIAGRKTSRRILEHFKSLGCPEKYLQAEENSKANNARRHRAASEK